jgi:hypothetical protein
MRHDSPDTIAWSPPNRELLVVLLSRPNAFYKSPQRSSADIIKKEAGVPHTAEGVSMWGLSDGSRQMLA